MSYESQGQRRLARELEPVTNYLKNQDLKQSIKRRKLEYGSSRTGNSSGKSIPDNPCTIGPDLQLRAFEKIILAERVRQRLPPLRKKALQKEAAKRRYAKALQQQKEIRQHIGKNAEQAMLNAAAMYPLADDDGMMFSEDNNAAGEWVTEGRWMERGGYRVEVDPANTIKLLSELYPGCFADIPSKYRQERERLWDRMAQEEDQLARDLLIYRSKARRDRPDPLDWPTGPYSLTLITHEAIYEATAVGTERVCAEHEKCDQHSFRQDLVSRGFIPGTLGRNVVAFSVEVLGFYLKVLAYGAVARQGWVKALCDHLNVEYTTHSRVLLSEAVQTYARLEAINKEKIDRMMRPAFSSSETVLAAEPSIASSGGMVEPVPLRQALKEDIGAEKCPCCFYELADEPTRKHSKFFTVDGNFSWKRMLRPREDQSRQLDDKWLRIPPTLVNAHEEKQSGQPRTLVEGEDTTERCAETQRSLSKTSAKHIDETGIVTLLCRHDVVWKYTDMIQSGEGIKHAKALIHWLIANDIAKGTVIGYDTGCTLSKSLAKSSILSSGVKDNQLTCVVGAFHGYSHVRKCQVEYHARFQEGMGLEDCEGCERLFSFTNKFAGMARNGSKYLRRWLLQQIIEHWNWQKYRNLGDLIRNNAKSAQTSLATAKRVLSTLRRACKDSPYSLSDADLEDYQQQEKDYLKKANGRGKIDDEPVLKKVRYMQAIADLIDLEKKFEKVELDLRPTQSTTSSSESSANSSLVPTIPSTSAIPVLPPSSAPASPPSVPGTASRASGSAARSVKHVSRPQLIRQHGELLWKIPTQKDLIELLRAEAGIEVEQGWRSGDTQGWIPGGQKWKEVQQEAAVLEHRKALKEVERECIQRMEEMDKMGFAGTAFRHRKQIMEAVRNRNKRLHELLDKCNELASTAKLTHTLTWDDAVGTTMEERMITILGGMTDLELASSAWAQPQIRQAIRAKMQADRAMEELQLLSLEWRRLRTWVSDREDVMKKVIEDTEKEVNEASDDSDHKQALVAGLYRRLVSLQLDHRKMLVALEKCKPQLMKLDGGNMSNAIPERSGYLQHLPEMTKYASSAQNHRLRPGKRFPDTKYVNLKSFSVSGNILDDSDNSERQSPEVVDSALMEDRAKEGVTRAEIVADTDAEPDEAEVEEMEGEREGLQNWLDDEI